MVYQLYFFKMRDFFCFILLMLISNEISGQDFCRYQPSDKNPPKEVKIATFKQRLTEDNTKDEWDQRYMVREDLWKKNDDSPVFVLLSGAYEASTKFMTIGAWVEWAKKLGALVFQLEHRYYGESKPTKDVTLDSLKYLTMKNAVLDVPLFVNAMRNKYKLTDKNKWILFGGGYAGTVATWAKLKNPNVIRGAIVSGAPLEALSDFTGYSNLVRLAYDEFDFNCRYNISRSVFHIERNFKNDKGIDTLKKEFKICDGFDGKSQDDKTLFYTAAFKYIDVAVEYNKGSDSKNNIAAVCEVMNDGSMKNQDERLAKVYTQRTNDCLEGSYKKYVERYKKTAWSDPGVKDGSRQWLYQRCNELGMFFATSVTGSTFTPGIIPVTFYEKLCQDVFGSDFDKAHLDKGISETNKNYGGLNIYVENVTAIVGSFDPWRYLAIPRGPSEKYIMMYLQGLSRCQDMKTPSTKDPKNLADARGKILSILKEWVAA